MSDPEQLAQRFEANRDHLRAVAFRMLGSLSEADDAVQRAWLRLSRADTDSVDNLTGWLTTVVARVCLDMLRSRKSRREDALAEHEHQERATAAPDPEHELLLANSVGLALLVVLETLTPAERLAFVLHDLFALPFDEIAPIVGRSSTATRQLASRARRRLQGPPVVPDAAARQQRELVEAYLAAARAGDFAALLELLDPDVVFRLDPATLPAGAPTQERGAEALARRAIQARARTAQPVLIDGEVGVIVAPRGRLQMVLRFTIRDAKIVEVEAIAAPERLAALELAVVDGPGGR